MKKYLSFLLSATLLYATSGNAQVKPSFTSLRTNPLDWSIKAKQNFYSLQKLGTRSVVARRTVPGGFQELVAGLREGSTETRKGSTQTSLQNGKIFCQNVTKEFDLSLAPEFNILRMSSQAFIFPGVISTGNAIMNESVTTPSGLPARKPMNLNFLLPGARQGTAVLNNPGTVDQALLNNLLAQNNNVNIPAMFGLDLTEVDSRFEFAAKLEASSGIFFPLEEFGIPAEVNAGSEFSGNVTGQTKRKTYLLRFIQPMFVIAQNENNPGTIFQDPNAGASRSDLVMINSVTYGRMVFIRIVSEENAGTVSAAVKSKLGIQLTELNIKAGNSIEGNASLASSSVVKEFKAVVIGGNLAGASNLITDPNRLASYINDPTASVLSPATGAVPISFTMVRVSDYNSLGMRSVGTFQVLEDCRTIEKFAVYIKNFGVSKVVDNPVSGNNEDIFGSITVKAFYKKADGSEAEIKDESERSSTVWSASSSSPLQLKENEFKYLFESGNSAIKEGVRRFSFTPEQIATGYIIVKFKFHDKIMQDGEQLGNGNPSVAYEEKEFKYLLREWGDLRDEKGCTIETKEVGGDAKICINFSKFRE